MSMIYYRQEQWTALQDVHPIWASISRRTYQALYFHLVAQISTTVIAQTSHGLLTRKTRARVTVRRCLM